MKVLILGATGHVGSHLHQHLLDNKVDSIASSRGRNNTPIANQIILDSLNFDELCAQLKNVDAVVNCVAGSKESISLGAQILTEAALAAGKPTIVHLSTMAVYGASEGNITEDYPFDPSHSWYAKAKCEAEKHMKTYAEAGGKVIILRPGCIHGPGSSQWVSGIIKLLQDHRLGNLGEAGNGWSNLVHVDDVVKAIGLSLEFPLNTGDLLCFNLAAPDSPSWNEYFIDLAHYMGIKPVKRIHSIQLKLDSLVLNPAIKILQKTLCKVGLAKLAQSLPETLPPSLLTLFKQRILLDCKKVMPHLTFLSYEKSLTSSVEWFKNQK